MIIPIGHEETEVRRLPWVTIAILVACIAAFIATDIPEATDSWLDDGAIDEATDYWLQHAYLEPSDEIFGEATYHMHDEQMEAFVHTLREANPGPSDSDVLAAEQQELDRLTSAALELNFGGDVENDFTRYGHTPTTPSLLSLITYQFMHGGLFHLLSNLFLLFLAAPAIEDRWGRPLFGSFYVLSGIAAGIFYSVLTPNSSVPLVGASGAIAGVLGAFLVRYWSTKINFAYIFFFGFRLVRGTFQAPAFLMLPLWFASELFQAWIFHSAGVTDGVAYWAHVGGFAFGAGTALLITHLKIEERFIHSAIESKVTFMEGNPVIEQAMQAREVGDEAGAFAMLAEESERSPEDQDLILAYWDSAVALGQPERASAAMLDTIRRATSAGEPEVAARFWSELSAVMPTVLADPNSLIRMLPALKEMDGPTRVPLALRQAVDPRNEGLTVGLAFRIIEQAREYDPPSALQAARTALSFDDIHETKRARLEELVENLEANGVEVATIEIPLPEVEAADGRAQLPDWDDDEPLLLEGEEGPTASVAASPQPQEAAPAETVGARALSFDGSLADDVAIDTLAQSPEDELGFDPSAQLDAIPAAQFGLDDNAELGMAPAEEVGEESAGVDISPFGHEGDEAIGLDPSELMPAVGTAAGVAAVIESATPPPLPSMQPPALPTPMATPPALPGSEPEGLTELTPLDEADGAEAPIEEAIHFEDGIDDDELRALIAIPRFSGVKVVDAVPREFADNGFVLQTGAGRKARIEYDKIQAVAVAAIDGLAKNSVVVIDLLLNWNDDEDLLRIVRLRSDRFDPRRIVEADSQMQAFRQFLQELATRSNATLLPDENAALANPLCKQPDLESYEREVLHAAS